MRSGLFGRIFHTRLQAENELGDFFEEIIQLNREKSQKDANDIISLLVQSEAEKKHFR